MSDIRVTLKDGAARAFPAGTAAAAVAAAISPSLAKRAVAVRVDGRLADIAVPLSGNCAVEFVARTDDDALPLIRHDCAHLLAQAVAQLFPDAKPTIGPAVENGFYYDFQRETPFAESDLAAIESRMRELARAAIPVVRESWTRADARKYYEDRGEPLKAELVDAVPEGEEISFYRQGDFVDLCRGPHMRTTADAGDGFKLLRVAGSYWRGDARRERLQRIYGTAWRDAKELRAYLKMLEEAEARDHRRLGPAMNLFHFQDEAAGMAFWHDPGWTVYRELENYIRRRQRAAGYIEVRTPQLADRRLWEASGHWDKFGANMYLAETAEALGEYAADSAARVFALKPMNCPCHVQIFKRGMKSYRDLPLRMAEFGSCHRAEPSGSLHGLMRARNFTQDDAHIFCAEEQVADETAKFCELLRTIYSELGFDSFQINYADRPETRAGSDEVWDRAESALKQACESAGVEWKLNAGEGAFYGPKLEFVLRDAIGREWQCGTWQVDFVLPERLDAEYAAADGSPRRPVMCHRAILGSFERFIGILIEHHAGRLPMWLSPVQAVVATITDRADAHALSVLERLRSAGLRATADLRNEKLNYKVREHSSRKVPVILVVGDRESESDEVSPRRLGGRGDPSRKTDEMTAELVAESRPPF